MKPRSARVFVLLVAMCMMSTLKVYRNVTADGFHASSVLPPILALMLACGVVAGVLAWLRKGNAWRDAAGLAHGGPRAITLLAVAAGGAVLSALAGAAARDGGRHGNIASPELEVDGRRVTSRALGLTLDLPDDWERLDVPSQVGTNFIVRHASTNTVFGGFALTVDRPSSLDATLQMMLDQKRAKYGAIDEVAWGEDRLGELRVRTVAFTFTGPNVPQRNLLWAGATGPYAFGFTCSGAATTFAGSEAKCRSTLSTITVSPP